MDFKVLVVNESTSKSIITDTYIFAWFIGCLFLNYYFLGNSTVLKIFICALIILGVWVRGKRFVKKMTPDEALEYLKNNQSVEQTGEKPGLDIYPANVPGKEHSTT